MTERSTEPRSTSGSRPAAKPGSKPPAKPAGRPAGKPAGSPASAQSGKPAGAGGSSDDTAVRPPLTERLQGRVTRAAEEHKANREAKKQAASAGSTAPAPTSGKGPSRGPRRARLRLTRIDPWSVMKTAFLLSVAFGIVTVVSVLMVWTVLDGAGVWESINRTVTDVVGQESASDFDVENYIGTSRVIGFTMLIAAVDVVLLTAIATLGAFLYNMAAALLGGIEVTLAEDN
ncbi:hypothetical protein NOK12_32730 [Nocardioides sp. OK12]|uniref:DUF3566 domain-containing protein n=1 Tax=Nocardioides sp. OK12 TaxID=2758661 RepID=UPI0021C2BCBD|nr:DUF3566 domain-containing protein [Nocardioides sp. OK12]GHJ60755.1 hypothetical protein NOK12_32730 [Nocardioides sp. OK12]